jgi:hypothetical protein
LLELDPACRARACRGCSPFPSASAIDTLKPVATTKKRSPITAKPPFKANGDSVSNGSRPVRSKVSRKQAAANALASVRAEGLDPHIAEPLLDRWASEEITDAQLDEGARRIAAGESLTDLLEPVRA